MASGPITSWQIDGETVETVADFIFWGSKITADGDCSHEIKRCLLLGIKLMTNLDNILKSRDITLPTKVHLVKAMVFPVVMYGCENWTIKKAECQRINAFELWCWRRRLLRVPWTARRSNQSILKEISPEYSLEDWCWSWNSNTLATWCEELTHLKRPWCWERLKAGGEGNDIGWEGWVASLTQWTWVWVNSGSWWCTGRPGVLQSMGSQSQTWLIDWIELNWTADGDCNHEIKRSLLLGRKVMTNLDSIFKNRDITLTIKIHLVKAMVFPLVMYGCKSWMVKKAECGRIDAFELWCWRRLLWVPWTARGSNQSILKISPGCSLEGLMLKLKLQYFGHLMQRVDSLEKP